MFILGNIYKSLLSCMSVSKTSVDNCQEAPLRSCAKDTPPLLTSPMRLLKRDSILKKGKISLSCQTLAPMRRSRGL
jgi:hypothetical protein